MKYPRSIATLAMIIPAAAFAQGEPVPQAAPNADFEPAFEGQTRAPAMQGIETSVETLTGDLEHPWGIVGLPGGGYLVTERPGRMRHVSPDGTLSEPISGLPEVDAREQGGLLDVNVPPNFDEDRMVYWTYAKRVGDGTVTAAARGVLSQDNTAVTDVEDIFLQAPPSQNPMHYGSRIVFGEGEFVYITTGEHFTEADRVLAQDLETHYGKVVRLNRDGSVPRDNPFVGAEGLDEIWSYGHRNIQSAAINPETGNLWIVEHGPAGGDELNRPEAGLNYGWPEVSYGVGYDETPIGTGQAHGEGYEQPIYYWDPVIAPSGATFYEGEGFDGWQRDLLIGSLTPGGVVRLELKDGRVTGEERVQDGIGRVRDVYEDDDGSILVLIDEEDGEILRLSAAE